MISFRNRGRCAGSGLLPSLVLVAACGGSATNVSGDGDGDNSGDGDGMSSDGGHSGTGAIGSGAMSSGDGGGSGDGGSNAGGTGSGGEWGTTGGGGSGGDATGGAATGGAGTGGGVTGVVEEPESTCSTAGALACAGNNQQVALVCSGGVWEISQVCPASQACDTAPGVSQGTCKDRHEDCDGLSPGGGTCSGDTTLISCGVDNLTLEEVECTGACFNEACDDRPNHCPYDYDYFVNCGSDCGEHHPSFCYEDILDAECLMAGVGVVVGTRTIVRIPNYASSCETTCEAPVRRAAIWVGPEEPPVRFKMTVPPPWKIVSASSGCPQGGGGCFIGEITSSLEILHVFTDDPSALEQNVVIESESLEDDELSCP